MCYKLACRVLDLSSLELEGAQWGPGFKHKFGGGFPERGFRVLRVQGLVKGACTFGVGSR